MYLRASNNNHALTAVEEYGLPSRIRIDRGRENVLINQYMLEHPQRGPDWTSVILGRMCIIKGLKDYGMTFIVVAYVYFTTFFISLRISECLKVVMFLICMLSTLCFFQLYKYNWTYLSDEGLTNHSLWTENNRTPLQLWILNTLMEQITHSDQLTEEWMLHKAFVLFSSNSK